MAEWKTAPSNSYCYIGPPGFTITDVGLNDGKRTFELWKQEFDEGSTRPRSEVVFRDPKFETVKKYHADKYE